jgi:GNAT superfamily N-acetyltransferase
LTSLKAWRGPARMLGSTPHEVAAMNCIEPVLPWALGPEYPHWSETLRDGTRVSIRPISKADVDRERGFIEALSPQSRRYRFLGQIGEPSPQLLAQLTDIDYVHDAAFAAIASADAQGPFIGVGRFNATSDGMSCECAVAVLDEWQHRGLGTILMKHLMQVARARGISYMYSLDAADNGAMAELADHLGFDRRADRDDPSLVVHSLWLSTQPE